MPNPFPPPVVPRFLHWISGRDLLWGVASCRLVHPYFGNALDLGLYPTRKASPLFFLYIFSTHSWLKNSLTACQSNFSGPEGTRQDFIFKFEIVFFFSIFLKFFFLN
jgi:hypothetical protein